MRRSGNISILVILLLLACSLFGVLAIHFLDAMREESRGIIDYYRAAYLARGGMEYALTMVARHGPGFEMSLSTGGVEMRVKARADELSARSFGGTGCLQPFVLSPDASLVLPLFWDTGSGIIHRGMILDQLDFQFSGDEKTDYSLGIFITSGQDLHPDGLYVKTGVDIHIFARDFQSYLRNVVNREDGDFALRSFDSPTFPYSTYFVVGNMGSKKMQFCLSTRDHSLLSTQDILITSQGMVNGVVVPLEARKSVSLPSFAVGN